MYFGFDIDKRFSFNHYLLFKLFCNDLLIVQVWSINHTVRFSHGQIQEYCFYWIEFSTGIFRKINSVLLEYQWVLKVGPVIAQHICHVCLIWGKIYVWELLVLPFTESLFPTNWYFLAFFLCSLNCSSLICKLWILLKTLRDI